MSAGKQTKLMYVRMQEGKGATVDVSTPWLLANNSSATNVGLAARALNTDYQRDRDIKN